MKYALHFNGRHKGAIGITHACRMVVDAETLEDAKLALYEHYEHITGIRLAEDPYVEVWGRKYRLVDERLEVKDGIGDFWKTSVYSGLIREVRLGAAVVPADGQEEALIAAFGRA